MFELKILHIIVCLGPSGAETMLKRLVESDPISIPNTMVVSLTSLGVIGKSLRNQGVNVQTLNLSSSGINIPIVAWQLVKLIRQFQPDIVQTWMYHADFLGGLAAYLAGYRNVVWGIHHSAFSSSDSRRTIMIMNICAFLSRKVPKKIICVAEAGKQAHTAAGYDTSRMVVIPNGFDFLHFTATAGQRDDLRLTCHFLKDDLVIGSVGRFHSDKGQDNFVKAAAIVVASHSRVKFLLIGQGCDANNTKLVGWLNDFGLRNHFVLLGERDDVPICLAAMDVFCMPSRTEAFPLGLGEAMSMGLPCVATNVGDTAVLTGNTAVLVPAQDEHALAHGLQKIIALTQSQRKQMGQLAKERVMREFPLEKLRRRYESIYLEIISGSKS